MQCLLLFKQEFHSVQEYPVLEPEQWLVGADSGSGATARGQLYAEMIDQEYHGKIFSFD